MRMRSSAHHAARSRRFARAAITLLIAGCSGSFPTRPALDLNPALAMSLTLSADSGDAAHPITLTARVTNVGRRTVVYFLDCIVTAPAIAIHSPDHDNINQPCGECPNVACPACAGAMLALEPGHSVETTRTFTGQLLHCDGPYSGPSGVYDVDASLEAQTSSGQKVSVTSDATFHWSVSAPR
jgi:hypothetical protein